MGDQQRITITDAEVLSVSGGIEEATDQPVVVLTLRPITGSGVGAVNYSLTVDNARSLLDRLTWMLNTDCGPTVLVGLPVHPRLRGSQQRDEEGKTHPALRTTTNHALGPP